MEARVMEMLKESRGQELPGMMNPALVKMLFRLQIAPWEGLVKEHMEAVLGSVKTFLQTVVVHLADDSTADGILREIIEPQMDQARNKVKEKIDDLLQPHLQGHPITYNHYFTDNIQKAREQLANKDIIERLQKFFAKASSGNSIATFPSVSMNANLSSITPNVNISTIANCLTSKTEADMDRYACSEVLVTMEAYYKVAMKTFIDNVAVQAVEACLVSKVPDMLSPTAVLELDSDKVRVIAEESLEAQVLREELMRKESVLDQGLKICRHHAGRKRKGMGDLVEGCEYRSAKSAKS